MLISHGTAVVLWKEAGFSPTMESILRMTAARRSTLFYAASTRAVLGTGIASNRTLKGDRLKVPFVQKTARGYSLR